MKELGDRKCPIKPSCKRMQPDGNCNWACVGGIVRSANMADQEDDSFKSSNRLPQIEEKSE